MTCPLQSVFAAGEASSPTAPAKTQQEQQVDLEQSVSKLPGSTGQQLSIINFYTWSGVLPRDLMDLKIAINTEKVHKLLRKELPKLKANIHDLQWDVTMARSTTSQRKMQIDLFQQEFNRLDNQVSIFNKTLTSTVSHLSTWHKNWTANKVKLASFTEQKTLAMATVIDPKEELNQIIVEALSLIDNQLELAMTEGKELINLQIQLQTIDVELKEIEKKNIKSRTQRTSPTILSPEFYKLIGVEIFIEAYTNTKQFFVLHYENIKENVHVVVIGCFFFIILCGCIYLTKNLIVASSRWYLFASSPLATTIFIITANFHFFNKQIDLIDFGYQWISIISILNLIAVIRLVKNCIYDRWKQKILSKLALFTVIIMLLAVLELPSLLLVLFVFYTSIIALIFYIKKLRVKSDDILVNITRKSWGIFPALVILLILMGYNRLALFVFTSFMSSVSICLVVWTLFYLNCGFLELLLTKIPFSLLRDNFSVIVKSLKSIIALFHIVLVIVALSVGWDIYPSMDQAFQSINDIGFHIAGMHISFRFLVTIYLVLYCAILFSRSTQALLLKEVLPRYKADKGAQLSIARLVHYAILTIGFLVLLKILGFELSQLTFLGGAIGIGLGFGLKEILSNFVSGLILLFERPIKVGDTIQFGTELGEVKKLGLRATIIQTFDNSEVVVPNANLITGQVTNWTLAERKIRLKIPVGVAYGTNVEKVLEILQACADSHPMVLSTPKPAALFMGFGASSLDFELRFWIPEFLEKMIATSELNQSIESEFALNNIEIPFLQTDLHIRSIDEGAVKAFSGKQATEDSE